MQRPSFGMVAPLGQRSRHTGFFPIEADKMNHAATASKHMTIGEGGLAIFFAILAFFSLFVAAKAYTPEYAFHAYLFAAASVAAVFAIVDRFFKRPAELPPLTVDGKPNYN